MPGSSSLNESLHHCLKTLKKSVDEAVLEKRIRTTHEEYLVEKSPTPESDIPGYRVDMSIETVMRPDSLDVHKHVDDMLESDESCIACLNELATLKKDQPRTQVDFWLGNALKVLAGDMADPEKSGQYSDAHLKRIAEEIILEFKGDIRAWNASAHLTGITVKQPLNVGELFVLHRVRVADILVKTPYRPFPLDARFIIPKPEVGGTMLRTSQDCRDSWDITQFVMRQAQLLRLFRLGSVLCQSINTVPDGFHVGATSQGASVRPPRIISYHFDESDIAGYLEYERVYGPLLRSVNDESRRLGPAAIGLSRYDSALLNSSDHSIRFVNGISALESVLLSDNSELGYKLSIRTATLIGCVRSNPLDVRNLVKKCYDIRSKYMHGRMVKETSDMRPLSIDFLNVVREVLLLTLMGRQKREHDDFIALVDDAIISPDRQSELKSLVVPPGTLSKVLFVHKSDKEKTD